MGVMRDGDGVYRPRLTYEDGVPQQSPIELDGIWGPREGRRETSLLQQYIFLYFSGIW